MLVASLIQSDQGQYWKPGDSDAKTMKKKDGPSNAKNK